MNNDAPVVTPCAADQFLEHFRQGGHKTFLPRRGSQEALRQETLLLLHFSCSGVNLTCSYLFLQYRTYFFRIRMHTRLSPFPDPDTPGTDPTLPSSSNNIKIPKNNVFIITDEMGH
jgi:hypothetical protein